MRAFAAMAMALPIASNMAALLVRHAPHSEAWHITAHIGLLCFSIQTAWIWTRKDWQ
jgi:hypothetical protein